MFAFFTLQAQWMPTDGPYGDAGVNSFTINSLNDIIASTSGGTFRLKNGLNRWEYLHGMQFDRSVNTPRGFFAGSSSGGFWQANGFSDFGENGFDWQNVTPDIDRDFFASIASMNDTLFVSVKKNSTSWPFDLPFILYSPGMGQNWSELVNPVPFAREDIRVYSAAGVLISVGAGEKIKTYTISNLPEGIYFVRFRENGIRKTEKLIWSAK